VLLEMSLVSLEEEVVVSEDDVVLSVGVDVVSDVVLAAGSSLVEKNVYVGPVVDAGAGVCDAGAAAGCAVEEVDARADEGSVAREPLSSSTTGVDANGSAGVFGALAAGAI